MDKPNQFKSSTFYMSKNDVLHMIIKGETGDIINIELMGSGSTIPEDYGGNLLEDYDSNVYTEVTIGNQKWIVENFRCTHYADGTLIPEIQNDVAWIADTSGAYCWYNNDSVVNIDYGLLYNWYAADNAHGLAYLTRGGVQEVGWRVPTKEDFEELESYLGGHGMWYVIGGRLKEVGTEHWNSPNDYATNDIGFTGFGSGIRAASGIFNYKGDYTRFWTPDSFTDNFKYYLELQRATGMYNISYSNKHGGYSIRLVKPMGTISTSFILAGTSSNEYILRSVDAGFSFINTGSKGIGNPTCFIELNNGDILYGTDQGYIVNYSTDNYISVTAYVVTAITQTTNGNIYAGDSDGALYVSIDSGITYNLYNTYSDYITALIPVVNDVLIFQLGTIQNLESTIYQVGFFNCATEVSNGDLYAGDNSGHIWQSTDAGETWVDLGTFEGFANNLYDIKELGNNRILVTGADGAYYTDNYFVATTMVVGLDDPKYIVKISDTICLISDGLSGKGACLLRSIDNGANFTEILSNPQQNEDEIKCLIYID